MKATLLIFIFSTLTGVVWQRSAPCDFSGSSTNPTPERLVSIRGKAMMTLPGSAREVPATTETLIFQKVGCESCFIGAHVNSDGNYEILVGDGKYKILVVRPSAPEVDLLAPNQERFIDTESVYNSTGTFNFDIKIRLPK